MIERIFGPHRSWQRQVCMVLSLVVAILGIVIMAVGDVAEGAMIAIVGIASGMILSRLVEATASKAATSALLGDIARMGGPAESRSTEGASTQEGKPRTDEPGRAEDGTGTAEDGTGTAEHDLSGR